ncbi:MAG: carboxypeptidase-like regulatory domain-containing protein, partial [Candidatus Hydrogenedentota bacterium]
EMTDKEGVATSDDNGAFRIPNVENGGYIVVASADGFAETRMDGVEIVGPGDNSGFQIVLNRGGCVSGIARVDGQTKAGLMVQLVGSTGNHQAITDARGYYEICAIAAGSYMAMVIDMENFSPTDMAGMRPNFVDVGDGESVTLNLVPPADGVSVSGVVAVPAGGMGFAMLMEPGAISMSTIDPLDMEASMEMARAMVGQAMIGPDGSFDFGLVPPGTYQLQVFSMNLDLDNMDLENLEEMSTMVPQATIEREITVVAGEPLFIDLSSP